MKGVSAIPIVRVEKENNYTVISNYIFHDKNLSLKAKGLLCVVLSLSETWSFSINGLVKICKEQKTSVKSTIDELVRNNYLTIKKQKDKRGRYKYDYTFFEHPYNDFLNAEKEQLDFNTV